MFFWSKRKSAKALLPAPVVESRIVVALARRMEWRRWSRDRISSVCGSVILHACLLAGLALVLNWARRETTEPSPQLQADWQSGAVEAVAMDRHSAPVDIGLAAADVLKLQKSPDPIDAIPNDLSQREISLPEVASPIQTPATDHVELSVAAKATAANEPLPKTGDGPAAAPSTDAGTLDPAGPKLADVNGRGRWRSDYAISAGGSQSSESAVERGLRWLKAHQNRDGSWHFNHATGPCNGLCRNPGTVGSSTGSTGLALLAFFGAGYSQKKESEYQETIQRGLYYLTSRLLMTPQGGDLQEGTMYSQGIATIALCEAYALTKDEVLKDYATAGIKFIIYAQDQRGGGWRYYPGEPGDTTVLGWQLMALKSGQMAGLDVPSPSFALSQKFLDSVQTDEGAGYGYQKPTPGKTTTSVGLLCRMYLGWERDRPAMKKGIAFLEKTGPSSDDMYFNYYAAQVLHHADSHGWPRFNGVLRDMLVKTQATEGHESGSWYFNGEHSPPGGRLYNTCLAILTLEVYYRHLPLFGEKSVTTKF